MVHRLCVGEFAFKDYHFDPAKIFLRKDSLARTRACRVLLYLILVYCCSETIGFFKVSF